MKLLILGASGCSGRWLVKLAYERGHDLKIIVRESTDFEAPDGVEVIRGNVLDRDILKAAISDCDAIISALGIKRKNPKNPWSKLASPDDLTSRIAKMLTNLMHEENVDRFIGISAAGVRESIHSVNLIIRWIILNSNMRASYRDLANMESALEKTALDWMAVRPVTLKDGAPTGKVKETDYYGLTKNISRGDMANWILDKVEQPVPFSKRTPMISSG